MHQILFTLLICLVALFPEGLKAQSSSLSIPGRARVIDDMIIDESRLTYPTSNTGISRPQGAFYSGLLETLKWPNGVVVYQFDSAITSQQKSQFMNACERWSHLANVQCVERTTESVYVRVSVQYNGCFGSIGWSNSVGLLNLGQGCWSENTILHEIGHTLGLMHEHQRSDRDTYIRINYANIQPNLVTSFDIVESTNPRGAYDHLSIMHYPAWAFAKPGLQSMEPTAPYLHLNSRMGTGQSRNGFLYPTDNDGSTLAMVYGNPVIVMPGPQSTINVRLLDRATGAPITGGQISLNQILFSSDANGYAVKIVPNGVYNATVTAPGYQTQYFPAVPVTANFSANLPMDRIPETGRNIEVRFVNAQNGQPIPNVEVSFNGSVSTSNDQGIMSRFLLYGAYAVSLNATGYGAVSVSYNHVPNMPTYSHVVPLQPIPTASWLRVRFLDATTGTPLPLVAVILGSNTYLSDGAGNIAVLVSHGHYNAEVRKTGYQTLTHSFYFGSDLNVGDVYLPRQ